MASHFLNELRATFAARANHTAIVHPGGALTHAEMDRRARQAAALLQRHGMSRGDRVALFTGAKLPFLISQLGVLYGGGIPLPLNPRFTREEMRHFLTDSGARLAVAGEESGLLDSLRPDLPHFKEVLRDAEVAEAPAGSWVEPDVKADDPGLIFYSSGTTGWPKGVVHTHANLSASLHALGECWRFTPDDVVVNVLPLFHIHGLSFATHLTLLTGGCILLEDTFHPQHTLAIIGQATVFMAVPTIYYRFLQEPTFPQAARSWRTRLFTCGSAPIRAEVLPRLEEILGNPVINRYGMTEAHVITSLPLDGPWPQGSVGLPLDGVELRVVGPDGRAATVGEVGSVLVRGPNLFRR